jgi:hypothetical protein
MMSEKIAQAKEKTRWQNIEKLTTLGCFLGQLAKQKNKKSTVYFVYISNVCKPQP